MPVSLNKKRIQFDDCSGVNYSLNKQLSKTQLPDTGYSEKTSKSNILSVLLLGLGLLSYSRKEKKSSKSLMSLLTNTGRLFNDNERIIYCITLR